MPATTTTITWPPTRETHIITTILNGSTITIPAYQTANLTLFPNYTTITTTTKPPPTTVIGANPPPPYVSGSPTSTATNQGDGPSTAVLWRNWGLVVLAVVILAIIGGLALRHYRSGRTKKQEPGTFAPVGEDDGGTSSTIPGGSSISLGTLGGHHHHHHPSQSAVTDSNVRERRNSQPIPRALDLDGHSRS
ncbi:hypothetical protein BC939DRAFT_503655 [Gamsiella multidivaricata]|uniref:uncharacterized protein n=1 Tax=Gamsiella multidivaricata TaxID=101098 RepID=UPI002220E3F9|nr:uncharacterized protein BC939DRAFT_503655 [Gamsiella multidivaricata]KAI7822645.1 hypothetical protein BC939DRAFT_503655 [Gamsiella multidivaricata]